MRRQVLRAGAIGLAYLGLGLAVPRVALGQTAAAVPNFDLTRATGVWHEVARYPAKVEKRCVTSSTVLTALGTKPGTFQLGIFCKQKDGSADEWDANGKVDKSGEGKLKITHLWPFRKKFWVLATGQNYEWLLVGSPNHKSLWILSKTAAMDPQVLATVEAKATAEGFSPAKLASLPTP